MKRLSGYTLLSLDSQVLRHWLIGTWDGGENLRHVGVTSTRAIRYADLAKIMREEPIDFIGVDCAVG